MPEFLSVLTITWLAGIFLVAGVILIIVEMFLPGFGVPGVSGIACIIVGFVLTVRTWIQGVTLLLIIAAILGIALFIAIRFYSKGALNRTQIVLSSELSGEEGFNALDETGVEPGLVGIVTTTLRPVGIVEIDGVKHEASSEASFIQKGSRVRVISTEGRRILVAPAELAQS